ncbi:VOC family protein [Brachybacterium paraconglomeratum]
MPAPNLFLIGVRDAEAATDFYSDLLEIAPSFVSPRYVAFAVAPGVLFALWTGYGDRVDPDVPRTSEVGLMVPGPAETIDELYTTWAAKGARVIEEPHDAIFGRTFVIADPDGNYLRVSPVD